MFIDILVLVVGILCTVTGITNAEEPFFCAFMLFIGLVFLAIGCWATWKDLEDRKALQRAETLKDYLFFPARQHGDMSDRRFDFEAFVAYAGGEAHLAKESLGFGRGQDLQLKAQVSDGVCMVHYTLRTTVSKQGGRIAATPHACRKRYGRNGYPLAEYKPSPGSPLVWGIGKYSHFATTRDVLDLWMADVWETSWRTADVPYPAIADVPLTNS